MWLSNISPDDQVSGGLDRNERRRRKPRCQGTERKPSQILVPSSSFTAGTGDLPDDEDAESSISTITTIGGGACGWDYNEEPHFCQEHTSRIGCNPLNIDTARLSCLASSDDLPTNISTVPRHFMLSSLMFTLLGIGLLLPWNAFLSAADYFNSRLCDSNNPAVRDSFEAVFGLVYNFSAVASLAIMTFLTIPSHTRAEFWIRMVGSRFWQCKRRSGANYETRCRRYQQFHHIALGSTMSKWTSASGAFQTSQCSASLAGEQDNTRDCIGIVKRSHHASLLTHQTETGETATDDSSSDVTGSAVKKGQEGPLKKGEEWRDSVSSRSSDVSSVTSLSHLYRNPILPVYHSPPGPPPSHAFNLHQQFFPLPPPRPSLDDKVNVKPTTRAGEGAKRQDLEVGRSNHNQHHLMILLPLLLYFVVFIFTAILTLHPSIDSDVFFCFTVVSLILCGASSAVVSAGVLSLANVFPPDCGVKPFVSGQALAGLVVSCANVIDVLITVEKSDERDYSEDPLVRHSPNGQGPEGTHLPDNMNYYSGVRSETRAYETALDPNSTLSLTSTRVLQSLASLLGAYDSQSDDSNKMATKKASSGSCTPYEVDWTTFSYFGMGALVLLVAVIVYVLLARLPITAFYQERSLHIDLENVVGPAHSFLSTRPWERLAGSDLTWTAHGAEAMMMVHKRINTVAMIIDEEKLTADASDMELLFRENGLNADCIATVHAEDEGSVDNDFAQLMSTHPMHSSHVNPLANRFCELRGDLRDPLLQPGGKDLSTPSPSPKRQITAGTDKAEPSWKSGVCKVKRKTSPGSWSCAKFHFMACFTTLFVTLSLFPAWTDQLKSVSIHPEQKQEGSQERPFDSGGDSHDYYNNLFFPVLFLLFNVFDYLGRATASRLFPMQLAVDAESFPGKLFMASVVRAVLFYPLFLLCSHRYRSEDGHSISSSLAQMPSFNSDWYPAIFMVLFAYSNGAILSLAFMHLPTVTRPEDQKLGATVMTFAVSLGLFLGSIASFVVVRIGTGEW